MCSSEGQKIIECHFMSAIHHVIGDSHLGAWNLLSRLTGLQAPWVHLPTHYWDYKCIIPHLGLKINK